MKNSETAFRATNSGSLQDVRQNAICCGVKARFSEDFPFVGHSPSTFQYFAVWQRGPMVHDQKFIIDAKGS
jgi:hypothetical protein